MTAQKRRLLLVDDEANVLQALRRVLRRRLAAEVEISAFDNPLQAIEHLRGTACDVVVSDFRMPQLDGIAFLEQVRALQPLAVRLVLSASTESETVVRAVNRVEVFRYLTKPWQEDELVSHLLAALDRSVQLREDNDLADGMRAQQDRLSAAQREARRLEREEPGITHVEWGPQGEVLMPGLPDVPEDGGQQG